MSQEGTETNRYARKTVKVKGLMKGKYKPNAKQIMAEHGVLWSIGGSPLLIEETTSEIKKTKIEITDTEGELQQLEMPTGFTQAERAWVMELVETSGGSWIEHTEEKVVVPDLPYINSPVRFLVEGEWSPIVQVMETTTFKVDMTRCLRELEITIEGKSKDDVANEMTNQWISQTVSKIRHALASAGFEEEEQIEIDCEVIMGAEREAKCDPNLMRSLIKEKPIKIHIESDLEYAERISQIDAEDEEE